MGEGTTAGHCSGPYFQFAAGNQERWEGFLLGNGGAGGGVVAAGVPGVGVGGCGRRIGAVGGERIVVRGGR